MTEIQKRLFELQDERYRDFQVKLIPTVDPASVIGVRTPELRRLAKMFAGREDISEFLDDLPHQYFDENQIHAFLISEIKDYDECITRLNQFLPYVDNWATCDQMSPKCFKKNHDLLPGQLLKWIGTNDIYTIRFAIVSYMSQFLDEDFDEEYLKIVASVKSDEYYINEKIVANDAKGIAPFLMAYNEYLLKK